MRLKHPNIKPDLFIEVDEDEVAAHVAAGWLEVKPRKSAAAKADNKDEK